MKRILLAALAALCLLAPAAHADTLTTNMLLNKQTVGGNTNTWGTNLNTNFQTIDDKLGTTTTVGTTGGTTTLTSTQELAQIIKVTGTLVSNATLQFSGRGGIWVISNETTGAFTLTAKLSGQTGVEVSQSSKTVVYSDAADIKSAITSPASPIPVGTMTDYGGTTAPSLWLLCYGQAISRTTYSALFAIVGTTYGTGDGSTTFNVPDARGRVIAGDDDMGGSSANRLTAATADTLNGDTLGATGGVETQTIATAELPSHTHTGPSHTHTGPSHTHTGTTASNGAHTHTEEGTSSGSAQNGSEDRASQSGTSTGSSGSHTHTFTSDAGGTGATGADGTGATGSTGSGTALGVMQPTLILNKIIYAGV